MRYRPSSTRWPVSSVPMPVLKSIGNYPERKPWQTNQKNKELGPSGEKHLEIFGSVRHCRTLWAPAERLSRNPPYDRWTETACSQPVMCPLNLFNNSSNKRRFSGQRVLSPSDSWEFAGGRQRSGPRPEGREARPHARRAERRPCLKPIELRHIAGREAAFSVLTLEIELTSLVRGWYEQTALSTGGKCVQ